ncbi:putative ABC transporter permease [Clostridium sp. CTA-5]
MELFKIANLDLYHLVYFFMIYSFLGWCVEVLYAYKNRGYFVNRGFLYGPFCPIYGCGLVSIIVFLDRFNLNIFLLFILATIVTSVIEYITGFMLEKIFKSKWWDYSDDPLNLHGRICFHFSLMWGAASVTVVKVIHPAIEYIVHNIPNGIGTYCFYIITVYFLIDFSLTIISLVKFKHLLSKLQVDTGDLLERCISFISSTKEKANFNSKKFEGKFGNLKLNLNHIRLVESFPTVSSNSFNSILKSLKDKILKKD